jgi:hypothetical protein
MLSPRAHCAWCDAGSSEPYCAGPMIDGNARYIGIFLNFHLW